MTAAVPTGEPAQLVAGDTWQWKKSLADYPAGDGWQLVTVFANATQRFAVASTADGNDHLLALTAAQSSSKVPGRYVWVTFAKLGAARHQVGAGECEVLPNLEGDRPWDRRSHARKVLEAIEAVIERRASKDQEEFAIGDISLKRMPIADLLVLRDRYKAEVAGEQAGAALAAGLNGAKRLMVRL
jgi:hypothetical protein